MAALSEPDRLSDKESADLFDRVKRFRAAWKPDGSTAVERYLPSTSARHWSTVLVHLIVADMERRAEGNLAFRVESYVTRFPVELPSESVPVAILVAEYQLRHQFGDQPALNSYQARFPAQYEELTSSLAPPNPNNVTQHALGHTAPNAGMLHEDPPPPSPPTAPKPKIGDLVVTNAGNLDATPVHDTESSILPNDTPYQIGRKIGSGAFGEVFEGLAPGGIRVAIKRILRNTDHPTSILEKQSLDAIKELSHPFLLKTNAYWVFDDRLVIVMELADGSLGDRMQYHASQGRDGVPVKELITLFEEAGEALDYLHSQNISHRDIKPENILILKGHAKVADFGLARFHEHVMTLVGNTVGTPAYMAPEMWKQKVSLQSDQYSLAATYVRARLSRPLFATTVLIDMANYHINETPNLDDLPEDEQAVLLKALAKNPDERFATCLEFAQALRAVAITPTIGSALTLSGRTASNKLQNTLVTEKPQPNQWVLEGVLRTLAVAFTCALIVGIVIWLLMPRVPTTPSGPGVAGPPEPEKKFAGYPEGWAPVENVETDVVDGRHYHRQLTRTVAGEKLVAILVRKARPSDPNVFYMLENKITNRVFAEMWKSVQKSQAPTLSLLKKDYPNYFRDAWKSGAEDLDKDPAEQGFYLGVEGLQAGVPVLSVSLPEALLVADEMGGQLPTVLQWKKAVGLLNDDTRPGPAGAEIKVPPEVEEEKRPHFLRAEFAKRKLALGLMKGPSPVESRTNDVSHCGIHQLATNGLEWLGEDPGGHQLSPASIPLGTRQAVVVGRPTNSLSMPTFDSLRIPGSQEWGAVTGQSAAGFRVVLKPQ